MPSIADVSVGKTAVLLTTSNVSALRVQNGGVFSVLLMGTVGAIAPTDWSGAITLRPNDIILPSTTLADLFPNIAANRVYAISEGLSSLSVAHA